MVRLLFVLVFLLPVPATAATAAEISAPSARTSDRGVLSRRNLTFVKEDIRLYFTEGQLIFSKPVAAAASPLFSADVEGGDGEVILPAGPGRAPRARAFANAPNLDQHIRAVPPFTGDVYEQPSATAANPGNRKAPEIAPAARQSEPRVAQPTSYQVRLTLDLQRRPRRLFAALLSSAGRATRYRLRPLHRRADSGGSGEHARKPPLLRYLDQFPQPLRAQGPQTGAPRRGGAGLPHRCHGRARSLAERDYPRQSPRQHNPAGG